MSVAALFLVFGVALLPAGCHGPAARPVRLRPVTANLDALVRSRPDWPGVMLYDRMLLRLSGSVAQADTGLRRPVPPLRLSALTGLGLPGGSFALPTATLQQQRLLLAQLQRGQLERLRRRRAQARALQLRVQTRVWRREARQGYDRAVAAANARFGSLFGVAFAADSALRLNLVLQIQALEKTIGHWALSAPPTPRLDRERQELASRRQQLALLDARQTGALAALDRERAAALTQAAAARIAFVAGQRAQTASRLLALDASALAAQRALLARETTALLARERQLVAAAVPGEDTLGPVALPSGTVPPPTGAGMRGAEVRLEAQRARWVRGLYAETRAAAEDVARQQGWRLTFSPPLRGEPDRTARLAALLASRTLGT